MDMAACNTCRDVLNIEAELNVRQKCKYILSAIN